MYRRLLSIPLRFKISIPYLIVVTLLAGLATYQVSRSFTSTLENRLRSQLEDGAARVAETVIEIENRHLQNIRSIVFTQGIPEALASGDTSLLSELIYPIILNEGIPLVEILDSEGMLLESWHASDVPANYITGELAAYNEWASVQAVITNTEDRLGDRFAEIVTTPWGDVFYTVAPVISTGGDRLGIVLVGTLIDTLVLELRDASIADVNLYRMDGTPGASTLSLSDEMVVQSNELNQLSANPVQLPIRKIESADRAYIETLGNLDLRSAPTGWVVGVALPETLVTNIQGPNIWQLLGIFALGIFSLIGLGVLVTQLIAVPVFRLVEATEQVSSGHLDTSVEVFSDDELGYLSRGFNHMVGELQQREFIREIFGRMVSEEVREAVLTGQVPLGGELRDVTVLFTDIRGFTNFSEKVNPEEIITLLNEFFAVVSRATQKRMGMINSFGGDSALVVFGAPIARPIEETLRQAIFTAMEIRLGIFELNAKRISEGLTPLHYGIGINAGQVVAGNLGTEKRFEYTVIGDAVNTAARLQSIARRFSYNPLLIPASNVDPYRDILDTNFEPLGNFELRGKENAVSTYAILEPKNFFPNYFIFFDNLKYPRITAILACYLFAKGYTRAIIAQTMEIDTDILEAILQIAKENTEPIATLLKTQFGISRKEFVRIKADQQK